MNYSRRSFLTKSALLGAAASVLGDSLLAREVPKIQGFDETETTIDASQEWKPFTDRKVKMGIIGFGCCQFGAQFGFQDHPNVEVVGVSDLFPDRCAALAKECRCEKQYESLEEMIKNDEIEAVFIATDAPSHAEHAIKALKAGKHVASAVPAVFGNLEDAFRLFETVKETGLIYGMFETSAFHDDVYAARKLYKAGVFGQMIYSEGEYYHYGCSSIPSYKNWRVGLPPQWYPTHSNAYYTCVTGNSFTEVSCVGHRNNYPYYKPGANKHDNPFGTEIALFKTSEGGSARMAVSWDSAGWGGEVGRMRGEFAGYFDELYTLNEEAEAKAKDVNILKPALPPNVDAGGHGGSHGYLACDFVDSILLNRHPLVNVAVALNTTVAGVVAHQSALKDAELLKIPQFQL
ncbi:MAG: Gfo/Idh/MocA family oxidoreductase [Thermoguttaceae bacterium]|nr:Gfo/Idh/MocA family oxidoreductase [Thermoguttaceae bacterium]